MRPADSRLSFSGTLLSGCFIIITILIAALPLSAQQDPLARALKSRGEVLLKRQAEADFATSLRPAMNTFNGDAIRAGGDGFASFMFLDDKTLLKIKAGSQFQFIESANTRTLDLQYGTIRSTMPQPIKSFRVETPVSVASVKGTDFWLIHDFDAGVDRAYGMEGAVEILNKISGIAQNLTPGTMIISTATGAVTPPVPVSPDELPTDPDEEVPRPEPEPGEPEGEIEEGVPEEVGAAEVPEVEAAQLEELFVEEEAPVAEPVAAAEAPEEEAAAPKKAGPGLGLGLGSVTLDGTVYYQIALRPEFSFGKIGIGLDLVGYMDAEGNFRKDEWDEASDYLDKILYLRYGTDQDPFFFKIGSMPQVQYGFGVLMNNYSNMTEFPQVRRVGFELGGRVGENFGLKGFTADVKELGGLVGLRGTYRVSKNFPLTLGINVVGDLNQYGGLKDKDDDGVPDLLDAFPDSVMWAIDSDGDGRPDDREDEIDIDGDGITDIVYPNDPRFPAYTLPDTLYLDDDIRRDPEPFNKKTSSRSTFGISADLSYPIFSSNALSMVAYAEVGMLNYGGQLYSVSGTDSASSGSGIVGPGLRAQIMKFLNLSIEYRSSSPFFQPGFFNTTYDFERAQFISSGATQAPDSVVTKDQVMIKNPSALSGYFASASANLFNLATFTAGYQQLMPADTSADESNSFIANLSVNTDMIPKISEATAFYIRTNDPEPFDFANPSSNTTWGYRLGYELGAGVSLVYNFQESYRDLDGNGMIEGKEEIVRLMTIETAFNF
ncbi:MAG: FecR domain-containing protein [Fidelibacterota bacterium]|nr:MAG: FecR domain-containing protein [Candidatus Neomarinimicrobiota bacterium]